MATQRPALEAAQNDFAGLLLAEREVAPRAQVIAAEFSAQLGGAAVVYLFDAGSTPRWSSKASVGEVNAPSSCEALTLAMLAETGHPLTFAGADLAREHYAHLDVRRTIVSLAYLPIHWEGVLMGAVEVVSFDRVLATADLARLNDTVRMSALALATARSYEDERNSTLESITRLTQFYDVEKVFHSTLQMERLLPIIPAKIREFLACDAVNLWMVESDSLVLTARDGHDPTVAVGAPEDDAVKWVSEKGKALRVRNSSDPMLAKRRAVDPNFVHGLLAVPVVEGGSLVGVIECVNKADGSEFDEDDHFLIATIAESAAGALHNASLLEAERKVEILETLVEVSQEITATLNIERVLQVLVNAPHRIMAYDRAAVALEEKGRIQIKAVSGKTEVLQSDPVLKPLGEMLEWAAAAEGELYVTVRGGKVLDEREETQLKFLEYFKQTGHRTWYSLPLADDQGRLGVLVFESRQAEFLGEAQMELIKVLSSQATVALRNASLYTEVPFIGLLEPILQKKQQFMRMDRTRRGTYVALGVAAVLFLILVPLPMRVTGAARISPQTRFQAQAALDGVVRNVYVHEGDRVVRGTVLADMEDSEQRAALAESQARRQTALAAMNRALADNDGTEAGIQRMQADMWNAEVARAQARLEQMKFRSAIDGVVSTPHTETLAGRKVSAGDPVLELVNVARASVDVAVDESDLPLIEAGDKAVVKLEGFPTRRFVGRVDVVSPVSSAEADKRVFYARVDVPNSEGLMRPGMQGYSKVSVGWKPAGYVIFRDFGMWSWSKLWNWFGW